MTKTLDSTAAPDTIRPGRPRSAAADQAIHDAVVASLIDHGFAGTSMTGIARIAGVSTATLYRRFGNLDEAVVSALAQQVHAYEVPDTGNLEQDLRAYIHDLVGELSHGLGRLLPALLDEAGRNRTLAQALDTHVTRPRRAAVTAMFTRAIARGEMRTDIELEMAIDLVAGPVYTRRLGRTNPLDKQAIDQLASLVAAALRP